MQCSQAAEYQNDINKMTDNPNSTQVRLSLSRSKKEPFV